MKNNTSDKSGQPAHHEIDMDAIRANLKLTPEQRILKLKANANFILGLRAALRVSRAADAKK